MENINCPDCGVDITSRSRNAKRCASCAINKERLDDLKRKRTPNRRAWAKKYRASEHFIRRKSYRQECGHKYYEKHRAAILEQCSKYAKTPVGKEVQSRAQKKYRKTDQGKRSSRMGASKRRNYGYNMLNVYFPGSVGHHINDMDVVFIPGDIHLSCCVYGNKERHREFVMNRYGDLDNMINNVLLENICGG